MARYSYGHSRGASDCDLGRVGDNTPEDPIFILSVRVVAAVTDC